MGFLAGDPPRRKLKESGAPISNLVPSMNAEKQRRMIDYMRQLNASNSNPELEARISSYELAFRMQMAAPDALDISRESRVTRALYGENRFSQQCLTARRLVKSAHGADLQWLRQE